ncbi:MAG: hypothetical protein EON93_02550 [Burkholderiales bacterium]|nr:MAG: hypothetical protein EON93_02550 [Burkholderiales bacterium]
MFILLLRILFPLDLVGRSREFMRGWLQMVMGWVMDPTNIADFAEFPEDRLWLEGHIAATEHAMQILVWERAREMLGLPFIYIRRQDNPRLRRAKTMAQLFRRLSQLAHNFRNLDTLAARSAAQMKREQTADPLSLHANDFMRVDAEASATPLEVLHRQRRGRWHARPCAHDGGGCALARGWLNATGPPLTSHYAFPDFPPQRSATENTHACPKRKRPSFRRAVAIPDIPELRSRGASHPSRQRRRTARGR